jgi:hypothetical protein
MGRRRHTPTPAVGITLGWRRDGRQVSSEGKVLLQTTSLRKAKRYFRTGKESR